MEAKERVESKTSSKIVDISLLRIGAKYLIQFDRVSFIGELNGFSKRHSQNFITVYEKDKRGKVVRSHEELRLAEPHYDVLVFKAKEQPIAESRGVVKKMFTDTTSETNNNGEVEQFYFTDTLLFKRNVIEEKIHDWAISNLLKVPNNKIGQSNSSVSIRIAESMMKKAGYSKESAELVISAIKEDALLLTDTKQYEWEALLDSQVNQLPF